MDGSLIAACLVGVVGIILIFAILKMAESLKSLDDKMSRVISLLEKKND